jgi:hypothetical protein
MEALKAADVVRRRRYWAIRTNRDYREVLLDELHQGRLRQGWGYHQDQDLRLIQTEIAKGGRWWDRLSATQKEVLPHLRMLGDVEDSVQRGDWIVVPNLPEDGTFLVAEVAGDYYYEPLKSEDDYGHVLPIRLLTPKAINKYAEKVDATLRGSLRTPMRMWCLDRYDEALDRLMNAVSQGVDLSSATSGEARLNNAWKVARTYAAQALRERFGAELDKRFQAAEWEEPIKAALEGIYPGADVRWVGGPKEGNNILDTPVVK